MQSCSICRQRFIPHKINTKKPRLTTSASFYAAASSMFSMKMPQPVVGSFTRTWVTAPTSFPSWMIGLPDTLMSSRGQKKFEEKLRFYPKNTQKRRFLHRSTRIPQLTQMKCRKYRILRLLAFSTNSDICRTVGFSFYIAKASGYPEALHALSNIALL